MTELIGQCGYVAKRHILHVYRQPWLIAIQLVQPFLWLLLFSATFSRISDIPGFGTDNYAQFFLPGLIVMTVLLVSGWNGMSLLADLERGTLDRLLASRVRPVALILGPLLQQIASAMVSTLILTGIGFTLGVRFRGGVLGVLVLFVALASIAMALAALSNAVALVVRREESLIGVVNFLVMPMTFLSTAFMPRDLVPGWVAVAVSANPVNWAVDLTRASYDGTLEASPVLTRITLLCLLAAGSLAIARSALTRYRRGG